MPDEKTLRFYDRSAGKYAGLTQTEKPGGYLKAFMALLPEGGAVLDLGCGPAQASAHMRNAGFQPDPVDASKGMVDLANETYDIGARVMTFDDLDADTAYDGVWANFSLLHAPLADLPRHLAAIATALRPSGVLHIGMKTGEGEHRDAIERLYTYVTVPQLRTLLENAEFTVLEIDEGEEMGCAGTVDPYVIMRARKNG